MRLNERGAIIIHVAIALIALLCFAGIVIDQGVMYVSRARRRLPLTPERWPAP